MTRKEAQENIAMLDKLGDEMRRDPALAKEMLMATGMYTPTGRIKRCFQHSKVPSNTSKVAPRAK